MTFNNIRDRIFKRWWLVLVVTLISTVSLYLWSSSVSYQASIGVGASFNSPAYTQSFKDGNGALAYVESVDKVFGKYLDSRFSSVEIRSLVAQTAGIGSTSTSTKLPWYTIGSPGGGFLSLTYSTDNNEDANNFIKAVKVAYKKIIAEWNEQKQVEFRVIEMQNFTETVVSFKKPLQLQILPLVVGLLLGILVSVAIPIKN